MRARFAGPAWQALARDRSWLKAGYIDGSDMDGEWIGTLGGGSASTATGA